MASCLASPGPATVGRWLAYGPGAGPPAPGPGARLVIERLRLGTRHPGPGTMAGRPRAGPGSSTGVPTGTPVTVTRAGPPAGREYGLAAATVTRPGAPAVTT